MSKLAYVCAAVGALAIAAPSMVSAQGIDVRIGSDRGVYRDHYRDRDYRDFRDSRAEFYGHDRGLHRGWYKHDGDRVVVIKKRRHWDD